MPSIDGPERKLARTHDHYKALQSATETLEADLNREGVTVEHDAESSLYLWRVQREESRRIDVALLFGDLVHNLRSTLDHLVWGLASSQHREARRHMPEFPIYRKPGPGSDGFHERGILKIWSLPAQAQVFIEGQQPYQGRDQQLWWLDRLDIIDKHRTIVTTEWSLSSAFGFMQPEVEPFFRVYGGPMNDRGIIADLDASSGYTPEYVDFRPTLEIRLSERRMPQLGIVRLGHQLYYFVKNELMQPLSEFFT